MDKNIPNKRLNLPITIGLGTIHLLAIPAFWYHSWSGFGLFIFFSWLTGCLGITLCFHRLLTHNSFKTPKWLRYVLTFNGCLAWQGGPKLWVGRHRLHHTHSDKPGDPHSPVLGGFFWAHCFWLLYTNPDGEDPFSVTKDLEREPGMNLIERFFWIPQVLLAGLLGWAGWYHRGLDTAITWVVWGVMVRTVFVYHITWLINSATHCWGYRNFSTDDGSRNIWWLCLFTFGESFHNNHHADPRSAAHGMRRFEFDLTYWTIRALAWVKLASDIKEPKVIPTG